MFVGAGCEFGVGCGEVERTLRMEGRVSEVDKGEGTAGVVGGVGICGSGEGTGGRSCLGCGLHGVSGGVGGN
jgi:hypothetical protein